ncbi:delta 1-pyrroline-5-carboxylate reductase [Entomortierella beljakovae]|nr:delta 1-pyrroline-5-carboxylate reductase [Entomortierella beljakovae]
MSSTKPQVAKAVLSSPGISEALKDKLLVSICAGVTIDQLRSWTTPSTTVIRAMPNTPCKIREGMTVLSCGPNTDIDSMTFTSNIFSTLGRCRVLDEKHLDAATALAGSGPAFACVMLEALADGGVMMGLPRDVAIELAAQVLQGAARMVLTTGAHPAAIKDSVTTPGGCTIAGLLTMEDGRIRSTLARTIQEATTVASTLGRNAVGDAYGLATEFMTKKSAQERYGNGPIAFGSDPGYPVWVDSHRSRWARNDFTDDTDQMLLILQSLEQTKDGRLHPVNFSKRLKEWSAIGFPELETPPRGIGYTIWNSRGRTLAANGAVMRTAVLGIESFWDEARVVENTLAAAKVTHADPRSIVSALVSSVLISRMLRGGGVDAASDDVRTWNPKLSHQEYREELLDYLRRGTDIKDEQSSEPVYEAETKLNTYVNKKAKAIVRTIMTTPSATVYDMESSNVITNVLGKISSIVGGKPTQLPDHTAKYKKKATLRDDIGWIGIDNVGEDCSMGQLARSVVRDYKFLLLETDLVPATVQNVNDDEVEDANQPSPTSVQEKWANELESHCFPKNLEQLQLGDSATMGYTFKCIGIGYYASTRLEDPSPTDKDYKGPSGLFRGLLEQITLEAGDADTNGAVVGSLLGARYGIKDGIPHSWWTKLEHFEWLNETVNHFADRVLSMYDEQI